MTRPRFSHINHESSRKAFETLVIEYDPHRISVLISITNLAERHLRLIGTAPQGHKFIFPISITNLAERHLRHLAIAEYNPLLLNINHESSRKAFETPYNFALLKTARAVLISITNLAERHLRLSMAAFQSGHGDVNINHESSRKAFETSLSRLSLSSSLPHINHESSRKAFETWLLMYPLAPPTGAYQSRI